MTVQELKERIHANSAAWHQTRDPERREALHRQNVWLYGILDGQTGSQSTFDPSNGRWTTSEPGTGAYQGRSAPQVADLSQEVGRRQQAATQAAVAKLTRAKEQWVGELKAEEAGLDEVYREARRQVSAGNEVAGKNAREQASDQGLSSGAAGQAALSRALADQEELGELSRQEARERAGLAAKRSQLEREYASAVAQAEAEGAYALADALYGEEARSDEARRELWEAQERFDRDTYEMAREGRRYAQELADEREREEYDRQQDAWERAYRLEQDAYDRQQDAWDKERELAAERLRERQLSDSRSETRFAQLLKLAQERAELGDYGGYGALGLTWSEIAEREERGREARG